ncbi:hypothetical protein DYB35_011381 [Aphanomyces astaci]|uniref:Histone deacetylase domain-containing protein n=1 Tax=Aphanomyces astaci TaxID=112090 RepID=A0A418DT14_APHAT|nr:hypothetical protein DYB35_011381 [Aphanomyces astaci]
MCGLFDVGLVGHHVGRNGRTPTAPSSGFCLLNNVVIGALHARMHPSVTRVAVLDWDIHHGNGTEELLRGDPRSFFASIHLYHNDFFPGTGPTASDANIVNVGLQNAGLGSGSEYDDWLCANTPDVPSSITATRGHRSWYQGLRYAAHVCAAKADQIQVASQINASLELGIVDNSCKLSTCPASFDVNGDRGPVDGKAGSGLYWGVNKDGQCFPVMNGYNGAYLCDPYTTNSKCTAPLHSDGNGNGNKIAPFAYQMDAISANWPVEFAAYSGYLKYQLEWVLGRRGYVRWMIDGVPLFEIPAEALESPPQNAAKSNPKKLMIEEPLYLIFNTALSTSWGTVPPNAGKPCRGDGLDPKVNRICDAYPLYLKLDYIRVWQNTSTMSVGCDPASHPTRLWIDGHKSEYEDIDNPNIDVWGGPRCTSNRGSVSGSSSDGPMGPPLVAVLIISVLATAAAAAIVYIRGRGKRLQLRFRGSMEEMAASKSAGSRTDTIRSRRVV